MITHYWLEKGISTLLLLVFAFLAFLSFGYPEYFDRLFLIFLFCLVTLYRRDPNVASISFLVLVVRFVGEFVFLYQGEFEEVFGYLVSAIIIYKFKFDKQISFLLLPLIVIGITSEVYWYLIDYDGPSLAIYALSIAVNCWLRYLLMYRVHLVQAFPQLKFTSVSLDFDLYKLIGASNIIVAAMFIEYLIRHLTPFEPLLVYHAYTYGLQLVYMLFPYLVISYIIKSKFTLTA